MKTYKLGFSGGERSALSFKRKKAEQRKLAFVAVKAAIARRNVYAVHRSRVGPQRPENDPVDHFQRGRAGRPRISEAALAVRIAHR